MRVWLTQDDYNRLLAEFTGPQVDPEVLLVSGVLHKDGQVEWSPFVRGANGVIDGATPGPYSIQLLNSAGSILYNESFDARFRILSAIPRDTDITPFEFAVPYSADVVTVQVTKNGQVLARTSVTSKLLRDAVLSIPAAGFIKDSVQRRNALLNKIDAFDKQLAAGDTTGARNKLQNDIRKQLVAWLVDGYPTQTPLEYTKPAILELVDELIGHLGG